MIDYPRFPISEMHQGKMPDSVESQCSKVNFKTEVCAKSADPHLTMHWIKEVEIAKSIDYPMTSQSITRRRDFSDYEMLDAKIASALKKPSHKRAFPKKSKCRRATCSERPPILARKADCLRGPRAFSGHRSLWSYTRSTRSFQKKRLQDDDVQDFDTSSSISSKWNTYGNGPGRIISSQNDRILFSFRLYWLRMNVRKFETTNHQATPDGRQQ